MTTIPNWVDPLSVDPDDRPAITTSNLAAIARAKAERPVQTGAGMALQAWAIAALASNGDMEDAA